MIKENQGELIIPLGTPHPDPCPQCGAELILRIFSYGPAYLCQRFPVCTGAASAHNDGVPLGTAVSKEIREWRIRLHDYIDQFWQRRNDSHERRKAVYKAMAEAMNTDEFHIAYLSTMEEISEAFTIAQRVLPRYF